MYPEKESANLSQREKDRIFKQYNITGTSPIQTLARSIPFVNRNIGDSKEAGSLFSGFKDMTKGFVGELTKVMEKVNDMKITMLGTHEINLNLNGAQVLEKILPELKDMLLKEIGKAISKNVPVEYRQEKGLK